MYVLAEPLPSLDETQDQAGNLWRTRESKMERKKLDDRRRVKTRLCEPLNLFKQVYIYIYIYYGIFAVFQTHASTINPPVGVQNAAVAFHITSFIDFIDRYFAKVAAPPFGSRG